MNKLILSTLLAVGVVCAKEHCELVEHKTYIDENYESMDIMCKEVPNADSVLYHFHLSYKYIDGLTITSYMNEITIREVYNSVGAYSCQYFKEIIDEYNIVIDEYSANYEQREGCKMKYKNTWIRLKRLGTYK